MPQPDRARDYARSKSPRPLMPSLASSRNVKSPITPRLATQHLLPAAAAATSAPTARSIQGSAPTTVRTPVADKAFASPARTLIASNVTPRSGSRKSRVDSNHSTPTSTPNAPRPGSLPDPHGSGARQPFVSQGVGLGIANGANRSRPGSVVGGPLSPGVAPQSRITGPMFFHVSDIQQSPELLPSVPSKKSPVFYYANGEQDESSKTSNQPSPPMSELNARSKSKFFHADGRADEDVPAVPSLPSPAATGLIQFPQHAHGAQPMSPPKEVSLHQTQSKDGSLAALSTARPMIARAGTSVEVANRRSISDGASRPGVRERTASLSCTELGPGLPMTKATPTALAECGLTPLREIPSPGVLNVSTPQPTVENPHPEHETPPRERENSMSTPALPFPQSPTKGPGGWQQQLTEAVMNARVERKIQDLEISNSSLMAINKSLEKEVKRQNKELRRFKRLSRAGRLSMMSAMTMETDVSLRDSEFGNLHGQLSILDELDELLEEDEEEVSSDDSSSSDEGSLSPAAIAEREDRKLARDSKRLQLDLARHREILVTTQKMNQSLRRCMAWSELMIKDGRKALDYRAEVELGGRVLDEEEESNHADDEGEEPRHSLLSSWTQSPITVLESLDDILGIDTTAITRRSWQSEEGVDSGIEIEGYPGTKALPRTVPEQVTAEAAEEEAEAFDILAAMVGARAPHPPIPS